MLVTCKNIGKAFIYWLLHHSTEIERHQICELLACPCNCDNGGGEECIPNWQPAGERYCVNNRWIEPQTDGCGHIRQYDTGDFCEAECTPGWEPSDEYRCVGDDYERKYVDRCDPYLEEWQYEGPVTWVTEFPFVTTCQNGTVHRRQVNSCGTEYRWFDTTAPCEVSCTEDWRDVEPLVQECRTDGFLWRLQTDLNGCSPDRMNKIGPIVWTEKEIRCIDGAPYQVYENQCGEEGNLTRVPRVWTDDGPPLTTDCAECEKHTWQNCDCDTYPNGCYLKRQTDQCGNGRWVPIEAIEWTPVNPQQTRCEGGVEQIKEANQCGTTRWVDSTDPATPCSLVPTPLIAPGLPGCCRQDGALANVMQVYNISNNGEIYSQSPCGTNLQATWLPSGQSASAYQFRVEGEGGISIVGWTTGGVSLTATCSGSNDGERKNVSIYWRATADTSNAVGTLYTLGLLEARCGQDCI